MMISLERKDFKVLFDYPTVVIGAGAAGLVIAIGLGKAGKKVLLVESGTYGGDCTHFGCVPSKTLLHASRHGPRETALDRTRATVAHFTKHEDPDALMKLAKIETLTGKARFIDEHTLVVDGRKITAKNIVVCTGSHPVIPTIDGLTEGYLTNETVFSLTEIPRRLGVLGGGAIGCELGQAFADLGSQVTLFEGMDSLMPLEEPEVGPVVKRAFEGKGIRVVTGSLVHKVVREGTGFLLHHAQGTTQVDQLLVCVGRRPTVDSLSLEAAGVVYDKRGIKVDAYGRTNKKHIWAAGDCSGGALFTHVAEAEARAILTSLILPLGLKKKLPTQPIPRVTYTTPEIAAIGLSERQALDQYGPAKIAVYTVPLAQVDRAVCCAATDGFIKIVTRKWSSKILGATIVAPRAGEMLMEISTAMYAGLPLRKLAGLLHPYPTYSLGIRKAADQWLTQTLLPLFRR